MNGYMNKMWRGYAMFATAFEEIIMFFSRFLIFTTKINQKLFYGWKKKIFEMSTGNHILLTWEFNARFVCNSCT